MQEWGQGDSPSAPGSAVDPFQGIVPSSMTGVVESRHAFSEDGRSLITTTLLLFSAAGALLLAPLAAESITKPGHVLCYGLATVCFGLVWPVTGVLRASAEAGYELYVSNTLNAAIVHRAAGIGAVPGIIRCGHEDGFCLCMNRQSNRLPHSWLDGIENARNRLQVFTPQSPTFSMRFLDWLFAKPALRETWGNTVALWPSDRRPDTARVASAPRELTAVWVNSGSTLLYSLRQLVSVARALGIIGVLLGASLTVHHLRKPLVRAIIDAHQTTPTESHVPPRGNP